jgi:hypothetical protein
VRNKNKNSRKGETSVGDIPTADINSASQGTGITAAHVDVANGRPINCNRDVHVSITCNKR